MSEIDLHKPFCVLCNQVLKSPEHSLIPIRVALIAIFDFLGGKPMIYKLFKVKT